MKRLDLNTKKSVHWDFGIFHFKRGEGIKSLKFQKIQIFKCNSAPNYYSIRKCHIKRVNLNAKTLFSVILEFFILNGEKERH